MNTITTKEWNTVATGPLTNKVVYLPNGIRVARYNIATTAVWIYAAWEKDERTATSSHNHGTITHDEQGCWGRINTRDLPAGINAIPADKQNLPKRLDAISVWRWNLNTEIEQAIWAAFPEVNGIRAVDGEIEIAVRNGGAL